MERKGRALRSVGVEEILVGTSSEMYSIAPWTPVGTGTYVFDCAIPFARCVMGI